MQAFTPENMYKLSTISTEIAQVCNTNSNGHLAYSQLEYLATLIKSFAENPIVSSSGLIKK